MQQIPWNTMCLGLAIVISLFFLVFFKDLRKKFKITVNCWFCNQDTSVPFPERNSFVCPSCRQYNGFEEDGSYNKAIPEQYDEMLNPQHNLSKTSKQPAKNGLCKLCNNNQQLKVYQLANFVPMNEDNYDMEIEHFQKQLEKAYKLCPKCDATVKKTIDKQNKWMLGMKMKYLKQKGVGVFDNCRRELSDVQKSHLIFSSLFLFSVSTLYFSGYLKKLLQVVLMDAPKKLCTYLQVYGYHNVVNILQTHTLPYYKIIGQNETVLSWICAITLLLSVIYIIYTTKTAVKQKTAEPNSYKFINTSRHERILQESYSDQELTHNNSLTITDLSSDSVSDSDAELVPKKKKNKKKSSRKSNEKYRMMPVFGEKASFKTSSFTDLNDSFTTVKSFNCNTDLNVSLTNLKLGFARTKPLIAPGKLKNPWTGRIWDADTISRSSSQSSGFCSYADNYNSPPGSICGEFECSSMISDPINRSFGSLENKFRPLNVSSRLGVYNLENKFKPLNVSPDNKSVYSCSTLKPGSIYSVKPERSLFSGPGFKPVNYCNSNCGGLGVYNSGLEKPVSLYNSFSDATSVQSLDFQGQYSPTKMCI